MYARMKREMEADMKLEYGNKLVEVLEQAEMKNLTVIEELASRFAKNIMDDKLIHTFGSGHSHMVGIELFARAGGLGNINAILDPDTLTVFGAKRSGAIERISGISDVIYDSNHIEEGDIMIITSNSGRNTMPIEMALRCKKEHIYTVAVTNVEQSKNSTSRHSSGKKLYECVDIVIDTCGPFGDVLTTIGEYKSGPASNIVSMFLLNTIVNEAIKKVVAAKGKPYVFSSQNVDGFDNDAIYEHFDGRCKHF